MSSIRLTGLATGIDTDQMIKELMKAERTRVDKVQQDKQILQWRQELYNSINKDFANFILNTRKEFGLNVTTTTGSIDSRTLSSLTWVKRALSSNESAVKASTTSQAIDGSYDITIHRLADGVKGASAEEISIGDKAKLSTQFGISGEIKFKINGEEFSFTGDNNINDVVKEINNRSGAGVRASYDASIDRFFIQTTATGDSAVLKIEPRYTDKETQTETPSEAGEKFLNALKLKITSYDNNGDVIPETEEDDRILHFDIDDGNYIKEYIGVNAKIAFNGADNISMQSNQFTINGINLDIRQADPGNKITIRVETDVDAVYDKIKGFVDKYNELVDKIGKLLGEKQYKDYRPLTAEQKEAMKEKEIELWEEKAKSGLLRNDSIISNIMQNIRGSLYLPVDGLGGSSPNTLYQLGIETEKYSIGSTGGKLEINEEKLKKAISEDVNRVLEILFDDAEVTTANGKTVPVKNSGGVITRIFNNMIEGMGSILGKAGPGDDSNLYRNINTRLMLDFVTEHSNISMLDKDIRDIDRRLSDLNIMLIDKEDRYYRQFSAMEKFVQQMNNQSNWLMQQLGM